MNDLLGPARVHVSIDAQIREVKRELGQRNHVYPKLVSAGKLTRANADRQIAAMQAVLATLAKAQNAADTAAAVDQAERDLLGDAA